MRHWAKVHGERPWWSANIGRQGTERAWRDVPCRLERKGKVVRWQGTLLSRGTWRDGWALPKPHSVLPYLGKARVLWCYAAAWYSPGPSKVLQRATKQAQCRNIRINVFKKQQL